MVMDFGCHGAATLPLKVLTPGPVEALTLSASGKQNLQLHSVRGHAMHSLAAPLTYLCSGRLHVTI